MSGLVSCVELRNWPAVVIFSGSTRRRGLPLQRTQLHYCCNDHVKRVRCETKLCTWRKLRHHKTPCHPTKPRALDTEAACMGQHTVLTPEPLLGIVSCLGRHGKTKRNHQMKKNISAKGKRALRLVKIPSMLIPSVLIATAVVNNSIQ